MNTDTTKTLSVNHSFTLISLKYFILFNFITITTTNQKKKPNLKTISV